MTTQTLTLTEFLLERIAEDEEAARNVKPLGHNVDMGGNRQDERFTHGRMGYASEDGYPRRLPDGGEGAHFARHDPARVLAECEAKRRIVEKVRRNVRDIPQGWLDSLLADLASIYADHPDYREEWQV